MRIKKKKKRKSLSLKKRKKTKPVITAAMLREDGATFWNSKAGKAIIADAKGEPFGTVVNVFDEASKVKSFKQLERFVDLYMPGLKPDQAATALAQFAKDDWLLLKILQDPDCMGSVATLLDKISQYPGGAAAAYKTEILKNFCEETGYRKPPTAKTFQNDVTRIKEFFGLKRKKKKVPYTWGQ